MARSPEKLWASSATIASSRKLRRTFCSIGYQPKNAATQLNTATTTSSAAMIRPSSPMRGLVSTHITAAPTTAKNSASGTSTPSTLSQSIAGSRSTTQNSAIGVTSQTRLNTTRIRGIQL